MKSNNPVEFLNEANNFLANQVILKRNKIKNKEELVTIYFLEYVDSRLEDDYLTHNAGVDIFSFIYQKVAKCCIEQKDISADMIIQKVMQFKKNKINSIIVENYGSKKRKIKELQSEIDRLKKGWL